LGRGVACQAVGGAAVAVALAVRVPGFESAGVFALADGAAARLGWRHATRRRAAVGRAGRRAMAEALLGRV